MHLRIAGAESYCNVGAIFNSDLVVLRQRDPRRLHVDARPFEFDVSVVCCGKHTDAKSLAGMVDQLERRLKVANHLRGVAS